MPVRMTPVEASRWFASRAAVLRDKVRAAEAETATDARIAAVRLSSGGYSTATLRKMGHPYARRSPRPPADPAVINRQTGLFASAWRSSSVLQSAGGTRVSLSNAAPYAQFMHGTTLMIRRPILDRIGERVTPRRYRRLRQAVRETFKP